ncbi:MAG: hypothetical protein ABII82_11910 [Verrucomicrobiota bacterium]
MNTPQKNTRKKPRRLLPAIVLGLLTATVATAQVNLIADDFNGSSVDAASWAVGGTGSLGITTVAGGSVTLDTNQQTTARHALLSHSTAIDPFAGPLTLALDGLALVGTPSGNPISLHAVIGRLPADTGGPATPTLAAAYTTGGGSYYAGGGTGGALGLSILR